MQRAWNLPCLPGDGLAFAVYGTWAGFLIPRSVVVFKNDHSNPAQDFMQRMIPKGTVNVILGGMLSDELALLKPTVPTVFFSLQFPRPPSLLFLESSQL